MQRLSERLADRLHGLAGRQILGIYLGQIAGLQLTREAEADGNGLSPSVPSDRAEAYFGGYPVRSTPKPGVWIVLDAGDGLTEEVEVA